MASNTGWEYFSDEQKPGFVAHAAGSTLDLDLGSTHEIVGLSTLKSHSNASGRLRVQCVSGCGCDEAVVEGRWALPVSVMFQTYLKVSPRCGG